jgi:two-component system, NtrC family, sensor kinase
VGIPEVHRQRVFEPFFTTKPSGTGHVGLGLSLAYETVRAYGGTLEAAPTPGGGATFTVTLPALPVRGRLFGAPRV